MQLGFENDFDIWHIYKYSVTTLILHDDEIHLVIKIPLADRDIPVSLIRAYDIPVPLSRNVTTNSKMGIFAQYDLRTTYMAIYRGYIKELSKVEYDDCVYAAGRFCMALTHMVATEHAESCLFALYAENDGDAQKFCSVKCSEKCLPYVKSLTELQWYITTHNKLELVITCPCKSHRQILSPPFSIFSLQKFCIGFSARLKLFPPVQTLGSVDQKLKMFETALVSWESKVDYRIFNNFSPRIIKTIPDILCKSPDGTKGISVSLHSEVIGELQYPDSKEFLLTLKSFSLIKTILKHVLISAVSLISTITFILALWRMHVFAFVWSGLKHCRWHKDELNCTARYQPGAAREVEMNWDEATGSTTSCMTNSNTACQTDTNTNMRTPRNVSANDLRTSRLIELCQAKIDSLEGDVN